MSTYMDVKIALCDDCLMFVANGTLGQDDDAADDFHAEKIFARWSDEWTLTYDVVDPHFSWSECDGCGSTLGGSRTDGLAFRR